MVTLLHWLLGSIAVLHVDAATTGSQNITSDAFFYGLSPPVYPTPEGTGTGSWAAAYAKAAALVAQMTLDEKTNLTIGISIENGCSGNIASIPRLGFPGFCLTDAGNGVRATDFVNAYASGISVGASWNKNLAYQRGRSMGGEFRTKGANVALGPVVGPLGRIVEGGRNWEGFATDPYLCGSLAFETVLGIQEMGVITSTKHFIGNEQETNRRPGTNAQGQNVQSVSSNIDDKTLHELYLWPFQDALHAGSGNIMCSYQRVNNSYSCANSKLLNGILKTELGFQGFVVSDWGAQHAGVATALAGLDLAMPNSEFWSPDLTTAVQNGSVPMSRIDDMATRIIAAWYQMGQDQNYPPRGVGMAAVLTAPHQIVNARDPASKQTLLDGAIEGHVLVKNTKNALPLKSPQLLSLYGYDGQAAAQNDINIAWTLGFESSDPSVAITIFAGGPAPQTAPLGTLISGGGSGANSPAYISAPFDGIQERAYLDNTALLWDFTNTTTNPVVDPASDACLVFINSFATEAADRTVLNDTYSDSLVVGVANQCNNTIVVIHNAGIRIVDAFITHPNVTAVLLAHLPGQDSGRALASLLWGDISPSGKLPYTLAKSATDYGTLLSPSLPADIHYLFPQSNFTEGIYTDYRAFDKAGITPRFEFGFGLSYTTFSYSNLQISHIPVVSTAPYPVGPIEQGGQTDLWDVLVQVTADITNTGTVAASEIAQLYIGIPGGPVRQLRGFNKVGIEPGQTVPVEFDLLRRDLSTWDVGAQKWNLQQGSYGVWLGASSRDLRLNGTLTI